MHRDTNRRWLIIGGAVLALLLPRGVEAQTALDRLSVHGHLTQAFGMSEQHQVLGIPEKGTADYRAAALQFRFAATDDDHFVIQFSHERFGRSPAVPGDADLDLDWVFYERRFGPATSVRVGKVAIPFGIYNEIRDVGTLLPFYRAPAGLYTERSFTNESVDGIVATHTIGYASPWGVQLDAFFGEWEVTNQDGVQADARNAVGGRAWLLTPIEGVRVGGGARRYTYDANDPASDPSTVWGWHASLDANTGRLLLRSEYAEEHFAPASDGRVRTLYGQLGVRVTDRLLLVGQAERQDFRIDVAGPFPLSADREFERDVAVGARFAILPGLVIKGEHHWYRGFRVEDVETNVFGGDPAHTMYTLLSVSISY